MPKWKTVPLIVYLSGVILPAVCALLRSELMPAVGVTLYAVLFWTGPFASTAAVMWNDWSTGWRVAWIVLVPVFVAAILALLFVPIAVE